MFQTLTHSFISLSLDEIKKLAEGDKVVVLLELDLPKKAVFDDATVVQPLFWNSDADEPGWEIETTLGFFDTNSIYRVERN